MQWLKKLFYKDAPSELPKPLSIAHIHCDDQMQSIYIEKYQDYYDMIMYNGWDGICLKISNIDEIQNLQKIFENKAAK